MREALTKTHTSAVAIIPPIEQWEPIQAIREVHDKQIRRWMPHINVLYPFVEHDRIDEVEPFIRAACARIEPFEISLTGFETFHHGRGRYTIWLMPEPDEPLQQLARELERELPDLAHQFQYESGFTPHLSVGRLDGYAAVKEFLAKHRPRWRPITWRLDELLVITRDAPPDDIFRFERPISLGN